MHDGDSAAVGRLIQYCGLSSSWLPWMYQPKVPIKSAAEIRAILGPDFPSQVAKVIDHIDGHCKAWIERCPFIVVASINAAGAMDTSPKGDPPGFVKVLDEHTLAIPDRLGNRRGDTFLNVLENPSVGIVFIIPKRREVVRVSGTASLARDPDLLAEMTVNGKVPDLAMIVRVREAFFHCGKSMIRSGLWEPDRWGPIDGLPSYAQALKDHGALDVSLDALQRGLERNETERLY
jgi:PPOX class probable FMN-dependent enzyme